MDISFGFDPSIIVSCFVLFFYAVAFLMITHSAQAWSTRDSIDEMIRDIFGLWKVFLVGLLPVIVVAQIASALVSGLSRENDDATTIDLAEHFGLTSGQESPLIMGDRGSGVVGGSVAQSGFFGSHAAVDLRPTSTLSVGFEKEGSWWQLTLPTDTVEYTKGAEQPTMTVWLNELSYGEPDSGNFENDVYWDNTWGACTWKIHNLWITCEKELLSSELIVSPEVERAGLANVVNQHFASARINLTNEQHAEIFPTD